MLLGKREQLLLPSAKGEWAARGTRGEEEVPGEFPLGDNELMWVGICKTMDSGLKSSQVNRDGVRRGPVFSELCQAHEISASNLTRFIHTEKTSPVGLCLSNFNFFFMSLESFPESFMTC